MKLIDVLVMISKGELEEGTKVKHNDAVLTYEKSCLMTEFGGKVRPIGIGVDSLNDEVELIGNTCEHEWKVETIRNGVENTRIFRRCVKCGFRQEAKYIKNTIEPLTWYDINTGKGFDTEVLDKLNEVIRELNRRSE